jgi:NADH dehydrogenase
MFRWRGFGGEPDRRVLILGGGFGGIYTALGLERQLRAEDRTEITLVSAENFFLFTPMLCEVASSSIDTNHAINPIRRMFRTARFVQGEATAIDVEARTVRVIHPGGHEQEYRYDHLVLSVGARTGFFGMKDVEEHALTAKTLGDALHLRNWAIEMLETAEVEPNPAKRAELLTFVVAGGGLTGVEMAGELNDLVRQALKSYPTLNQREVRIILVEAMPRLMPEFDANLANFAMSRLRAAGVEVWLNARVSGAGANVVHLASGSSINTRTLVWTTGVAPNPFIAASPLPKDERGWIVVDAHMRVAGLPGVWALGDCARVPDVTRPGHNHPATAQHAIRQASQLAANIAAVIHGLPTQPFLYKTLGQMATLGHYNGVGVIGGLRVWGFPAWVLWRSYYLWRLPRLEKRLRVAVDWTVDLFFGRDISMFLTEPDIKRRMARTSTQSAPLALSQAADRRARGGRPGT